jgi:predicted secreted protein
MILSSQGSDGEITVAGVREVQVETQAELMDIIAAATQARWVVGGGVCAMLVVSNTGEVVLVTGDG